jgi:hypothetical protein
MGCPACSEITERLFLRRNAILHVEDFFDDIVMNEQHEPASLFLSGCL